MSDTRDIKKKNVSDSQKEKHEQVIVNRMMIVFCAVVAIVIVLLSVCHGGHAERTFVLKVLPVFKIAGLVFVAASAVWYFLKRGSEQKDRLFSPALLLTSSIVFCLCSFLYTYVGVVITVAAIIAAAAAAFVYHFYQKDFFWFTLLTIIEAAGLLCLKSNSGGYVLKAVITYAAGAATLICSLIAVAVIIMLKKGNGEAKIGSLNIKMPSGGLYLPFVLASSLSIIGSGIAFAFPAAAVYAVFALLALYLVYAVIYTVKLM